MNFFLKLFAAVAAISLSFGAAAQAVKCPDKNVQYWQAFPPGGESDMSARHQQKVLKAKCPSIDTVVQYKAGAGGALLWGQLNQLPADGLNVAGVNLPHIVFQPLEGQVQFKTADITPVYWFHYTPDILVVPVSSPIKSWADFLAAAKAKPNQINLGGSGLNSANHAATERMNAAFNIKTNYIPYKGTGDMATAVIGAQIDGAMTYTPFAIAQKEKVRPLAVAMERRHPLMPNVPTFKELGVNWVDGAYRGIGVPKGATAEQKKALSDLWRNLNNDADMKKLAADAGFELINVGFEEMDAFMREKTKLYTEGAARLGLGK